jgi:uncharacterized membrane protein
VNIHIDDLSTVGGQTLKNQAKMKVTLLTLAVIALSMNSGIKDTSNV